MNKGITIRRLLTLSSGAMLMVLCLLQPAAVKAQWTTPDGNRISTTPTQAMWVWGLRRLRRNCMSVALSGSRIPMDRVRYRLPGPLEEPAFRAPAALDIPC
jgi:hypothetical protein